MEITTIKIDLETKELLEKLKEEIGARSYNELLRMLITKKEEEIIEKELERINYQLKKLESVINHINSKHQELLRNVQSKINWLNEKKRMLEEKKKKIEERKKNINIEEEYEKLKVEYEKLKNELANIKAGITKITIDENVLSFIRHTLISEFYKYFLSKIYSKEEIEKIDTTKIFEKFQIGGEATILEDLKKNYDKYKNMTVFDLKNLINDMFERLKQTAQASQVPQNKQ